MQPLQPQSVSLSQMQNNEISVFASEQPAEPQYIQQWVAVMAAAFPQMRAEFWTICSKMVRKEKLSQKRLAYIGDTMCKEWHYPTMTIADIFNIDKMVRIWQYSDFLAHFRTDYVAGYCILKERARDGRIQFCVTEDAKAIGLEIEREML